MLRPLAHVQLFLALLGQGHDVGDSPPGKDRVCVDVPDALRLGSERDRGEDALGLGTVPDTLEQALDGVTLSPGEDVAQRLPLFRWASQP